MTRLRTSTRALRHRNYRLFFAGQAVSLIGSWMTRLATSWLVYRLTGDPVMLGIVAFAGLVPSFVLAPVCGVLVDRAANLQRLIFCTQLAATLQSIGLVVVAAAPIAPGSAVGFLIALNVAQGIISAFDVPARQAFLPRMIPDPKDLSNGIALNSTLFNAARLLGPALAGVIVALAGEAWCFALDAVSYAAVLWALTLIRLPSEGGISQSHRPSIWQGLKEGVQYVRGRPMIRASLALVAILSFVGMPYAVLLPIYAKEILHGGPHTLGMLTSAAGLGAVGAALVLAGRETTAGLPKWILTAGIAFSASLSAFAFSTSLVLSIGLLGTVGFGMLMQTASCNTIIQTTVDPDKRGRIMSLYSMAFLGMAPFGSLAAGFGAAKIGAPATLALSAVCCLVASGFFATRMLVSERGVDPLKASPSL